MGLLKYSLLTFFYILTHFSKNILAIDPPYGQLKITGRHVTDAQGNVVQLRGMSAMQSDYISDFNNEETVFQVKCSWNGNIIRAAQAPSTSCCGGWSNTKDRDFERLAAVIEAAIKHGIYVIADWHAFGDPEIDLAKDFFANVSKTYGSYPHIIYEIWNEPDGVNGTWPAVKAYADVIIPIIRANDPDNIIVVGTPSYSQRVDVAANDTISGTNIAYTLHYYAATHKQGLRDIALTAINQGLPIFITEYGTVEATGGGAVDYESSMLWWEFNDQYQLSYVNFALFTSMVAGSNCCKHGTNATQIGDPEVWTPSGKLVHKKMMSTDQGVGSCNTLNRLDCHPDPNSDQNSCTARGCTYDPNYDMIDSPINAPHCYFPQNTGYIAEVPVNSSNTITLKKSSNSAKNPYSQDFDELTFQHTELGSALYISISPKGVTRFRPPVPINSNAQIVSTEKLNIIKNNGSIFSFSVQRQSSGAKIWDTSIGGLLFGDKYLQIATYLPTDKIYGFGEHLHTSLKHNVSAYKTWGMWAKDNGGIFLDKNLYGVHPFYMAIEDNGNAHGVFIFNSNAQEVTIGPAPHLVYRTIGGQLDIFYFPGPSPEQVIQQYQQIIGTPFLPSYWALGFHICRYGYQSTQDVQTVVNRTIGYNIPFDVAWADINYMDRYKDFTLDQTNWSDFGTYTNYLHTLGMHVILITDPGIEVDYDSFQRGLAQNASFIEWPRADMVPQNINNQYPLVNGTKILLGVVWPDHHVAFPDFLDPTGQTNQWWSNEFAKFRETVAIDGVWIDMNEISNFNTGFYNSTSQKIYHIKSPRDQPLLCPISGPDAEFDAPPYLTYSVYTNGPQLATDTVCMCAVTGRGSQTFYDTKNLYGWSEMVATDLVQKQAIGKRGAVISRSTFPSSGSYGGHWLGDNHATWDDLKYSIIGIQEFNMFGIPFVGADICGFEQATTEELCLRWQQLGAFYPFMRNHNDNGQPAQDPGVWPSVAEATRKSNLFRYRHLPYLYTLLFNASLNGGTVARPVFFEFPNDTATYELSLQFMWGPALMIVPVTDQFVAEVSGYLPVSAAWYSVYDYFYGTSVNANYSSFPAPSEYMTPTFIRAGYIIPRQLPSVTTTLSRQNPFQLLVALASTRSNGQTHHLAYGELYWDDGETIVDNINTYNYYHFEYSFSAKTDLANLTISRTKQAMGITLPTLDNIEVFGLPYAPNFSTVKLNGSPITINTAISSYSPFTKVLNITTTNFINLNNNGPTWTLTWNNQ